MKTSYTASIFFLLLFQAFALNLIQAQNISALPVWEGYLDQNEGHGLKGLMHNLDFSNVASFYSSNGYSFTSINGKAPHSK